MGRRFNNPQIHFSLDTGGLIEYTPAQQVVLRMEAGDALVCYHSHTVSYLSYARDLRSIAS